MFFRMIRLPFWLCLLALTLNSCFHQSEVPTPETFLTLADLSGKTSFKEESPDVRVINVKAKAKIKQNDIRAAKAVAVENASIKAVDEMVRELLSVDVYNKEYPKIEDYLSKNIHNYIDDYEVTAEKKVFNNEFYGVAVSFKVNRQKVLVVLQKQLKLINTSSSTLITVVTSKKNIDLSKSGFVFSDIENSLMNQIQTDLNQRGLRAMDYRNAIASLQTDDTKKAAFSRLSKEQFLVAIEGSKAGDAQLNEQLRGAEEFYSTGLTLVKELAKVVIEVNIFAINGNVNKDLALSLNVTAKNISTGVGGAFANTVVNVARRGGPDAIPSALITGLVKDAYEEMKQQFIPQVIAEMSNISVGGDKLVSYQLVMKGFESARELSRVMTGLQDQGFRYNDQVDTSVPTLITFEVRYAGKPFNLANKIMDALDEKGIKVQEPTVAPDLTELVFIKK